MIPYVDKVLFGSGPSDFRLIRRGHLWTVHVAFWKQRPAHQIVAKPDGLILAAHGTRGACGVPLIGGDKGATFAWLEDFRLHPEAVLCRNCLRVKMVRQWLLDGNWKLDPVVVPPQFKGGDPMWEMDSEVMRGLAQGARMGLGGSAGFSTE